MRLFVTGATGFIGSHFVNHALGAGHEITGLRRSLESRPRIALENEPRWLTKSIECVEPTDFSGETVLVHLAAHTPNVPYDTLAYCLHWNLAAPLQLFRAAHAAGINRFVVAGSCFEYGRAGERYDFIPPDAPLEPTLSYPASKAAASIAFTAFAAETGAQLSIHRIFQVYGEGETASRLWPSLRQAAQSGADLPLTPGEQVRDFIAVGEVAAKLLSACADVSVEPGVAKVENLGTGRPQTIRQFAETWWNHWGAKGRLLFGATPYRAGEVMRYVPLITVPSNAAGTSAAA